MSFLETGRALYLLAAICLGGIMVRLAAGSFYKRLIRESSNLALAKTGICAPCARMRRIHTGSIWE